MAHLKAAAEKAGGTLVAVETNPIDAVWSDQPAPPVTPAKPHALNLAGEQSEAKRLRLGDGLKKAGAEAAVITLADSVCWLLNIRGDDVPHTPFTLAFAILHDDGGADLFLDPAKRTPELMAHLGNAVQVHAPGRIRRRAGRDEGQKRAGRPSTAASAIFDRLNKAGAKIRHGADPCQLPKACKNPRNRRHAQGPYPRRRGAGALSRLVREQCGGRRADRNRRPPKPWKASAAPPASSATCPSTPSRARAATAPSCITG